MPPINLKSALYAIVPLPPLCVKKILPVCPVLHPVGLANVCAAVTVVLKFCALPKFNDTDATPLIAVAHTTAAALLVNCNCPSNEVLPDTLTVPKKPELPVIVVVPPTFNVELI